MSGWSNLTMATMPGTEYLMPSGISGLDVPMAGTGYDMGGFGNLYADPVGVGDGGGNPYHPMGKVDTDAEDYISIHVPVAPTSDDTHANLLYKEVLAFNHRDPPGPGTNSEITTLVPINWLNIWLDKMWRIGFPKLETFAKAFMSKYQSHFPEVFKNTLKNNSGKTMGHVNTHKMTMGSTVSNLFGGGGVGNMAFAYGGWNSNNSGGGGDAGGNSDDEGDYEDTQIDHDKLMSAFIKYLSEEMPPPDLLFNESASLAWASTKFSSPQQSDITSWLSEIAAEVQREKTRTAGFHQNQPTDDDSLSPTSRQEEVVMEELSDALALQRDLVGKEAMLERGSSNEGGRGGGGGGGAGSGVHFATAPDPLKESDLGKFILVLKDREEKRRQMKAEVMEFFQYAANEPHHLQFSNDPSGIDYLFRGGFYKNWSWTGVIQTMHDDTSRKHSFGIPFATYPLAKVIVERETITYNLWGGDLRTGTQLYLKLERSSLIKKPPRKVFSSTNWNSSWGGSGGAAGYVQEKMEDRDFYLEKIKSIGDQVGQAWKNFGSYRVIPYHNGLEQPKVSDLEYLNIFGIKERAILIPVGMVKYDTPAYDYNYSVRNLALGLPNPDTKIPPSLDASKAAMIGLPKITVILRSSV